MRTFVLAAGFLTASTLAAFGAPQSYPLQVEAGTLKGDGAVVLEREIKSAQFILFGEDHGFADAPVVLGAIAKSARKDGFGDYATEVGPLTAKIVGDTLTQGSIAGMHRLVHAAPLAIPFLSQKEDAQVAALYASGGHLWGLDQEFVGAPMLLLRRLVELAPDTDARDAATRYLAAERQAVAAGAQDKFLLFSATKSDLDALASRFKGIAEAEEIIAGLGASAAIYQDFLKGANYTSNAERGALIAANFLSRYRAAHEPKVIFKMGADHLGLGTSPNNITDVGTLASEIAAAKGRKSVRILFLPEGGSHLTFAPKPGDPFSTEVYDDADVKDFFASIGIAKTDLNAEGWTLIPLATVRAALETDKINALKPMARFLLLGFDYLITTPDAKPATSLY